MLSFTKSCLAFWWHGLCFWICESLGRIRFEPMLTSVGLVLQCMCLDFYFGSWTTSYAPVRGLDVDRFFQRCKRASQTFSIKNNQSFIFCSRDPQAFEPVSCLVALIGRLLVVFANCPCPTTTSHLPGYRKQLHNRTYGP